MPLFVVTAITAASCACAPQIEPDAAKLALWTTDLRDSQPEDAFAAVYRVGGKHLIFVAAEHATDTRSLTFAMIGAAYAAFDVDALIVEGFAHSEGANAPRLLDWASKQKQVGHFQAGGETAPAVNGALEQGAAILGGELDDRAVRELAMADGIAAADMLGFYTLRTAPQWVREKKIDGGGDPRVNEFLEAELQANRDRLGISHDVLPDVAAWRDWYEHINAKPFGADFVLEETGPLVDGPYGTNRIAAAISRARDAFLLDLMAARLRKRETALVVFGASHLMIQRPALDAMLGAPCYAGDDLARAEEACSG